MKSFVFLHLWVAMATGSDIWTALYSAEECLNSALLQDAIVAPGECVVGKLSDGTTVSKVHLDLTYHHVIGLIISQFFIPMDSYCGIFSLHLIIFIQCNRHLQNSPAVGPQNLHLGRLEYTMGALVWGSRS